MLKKLLLTIPLLSFHVTSNDDLELYESVLNVQDNNNRTYTVYCENGDEGQVALEEENICALSQSNDKNFCNLSTIWTIQDAAALICSPISED